MSAENFEDKLLKEIREKHLEPKSRWRFLLSNYAVWGAGILALAIGSLAVAVIIYMFLTNDWAAYKKAGKSFWEFALLTLPYFWLLLLAIFVLIINYNIRHTKNGYRYPLPVIAGASVAASLLFGGVFYAVGLGQAIDEILGERAPFYREVFNNRIDYWSDPEEGRLTGLVVSKMDESRFWLFSLEKQEWQVDATDAHYAPGAVVKIGLPVRLIGQASGTAFFIAKEILPAGAGQRFYLRHRREHIPMLPTDFMPDGKMPEGGPGMQRFMELSRLFEKYPDLKIEFVENLRADRGQLEKMLERDPGFLERLREIGVEIGK